MNKTGQIIAAVVLVFLGTTVPAIADYQYNPASAELQSLAVIEPTTPDSLFKTWTGDVESAGRSNLGISLDYLRNQEDSGDWDVIFNATGLFRSGDNLLFGITAPYIIRDSNFNESDLLDLRLFARRRLLGQAPAFRISGEVSAILPTANDGGSFPLTLDSTVLGARLAFTAGSEALRGGVNVGYQTYLATESGSDNDMLYGAWLEKDLEGPWKLAGVYSSSTHEHSGTPGNDSITDGYLQVGVKRTHSDKTNFGLALGTGTGGDSAADLRITATATFILGDAKTAKKEEKQVREKKEIEEKAEIKEKKAVKPPAAKAPVYSGPVVVMIAEGITDKDTEKKVTKALQKKGYATGMDPDPGIKASRKNVLWYNAGMQEQAISVSRTLVMGGHLKDLQIKESKKPIFRNWMILVLGGEKK